MQHLFFIGYSLCSGSNVLLCRSGRVGSDDLGFGLQFKAHADLYQGSYHNHFVTLQRETAYPIKSEEFYFIIVLHLSM